MIRVSKKIKMFCFVRGSVNYEKIMTFAERFQSKLVESYHKIYHRLKATIKPTIRYFLDKNLGI